MGSSGFAGSSRQSCRDRARRHRTVQIGEQGTRMVRVDPRGTAMSVRCSFGSASRRESDRNAGESGPCHAPDPARSHPETSARPSQARSPSLASAARLSPAYERASTATSQRRPYLETGTHACVRNEIARTRRPPSGAAPHRGRRIACRCLHQPGPNKTRPRARCTGHRTFLGPPVFVTRVPQGTLPRRSGGVPDTRALAQQEAWVPGAGRKRWPVTNSDVTRNHTRFPPSSDSGSRRSKRARSA